jgi:hypothetical protein
MSWDKYLYLESNKRGPCIFSFFNIQLRKVSWKYQTFSWLQCKKGQHHLLTEMYTCSIWFTCTRSLAENNRLLQMKKKKSKIVKRNNFFQTDQLVSIVGTARFISSFYMYLKQKLEKKKWSWNYDIMHWLCIFCKYRESLPCKNKTKQTKNTYDVACAQCFQNITML